MNTSKNNPQNLLIIHNQQFFSLPWLPKRPILDRNRNFIGSPCLLSTISLLAIYHPKTFYSEILLVKVVMNGENDFYVLKSKNRFGKCLVPFSVKILVKKVYWYNNLILFRNFNLLEAVWVNVFWQQHFDSFSRMRGNLRGFYYCAISSCNSSSHRCQWNM